MECRIFHHQMQNRKEEKICTQKVENPQHGGKIPTFPLTAARIFLRFDYIKLNLQFSGFLTSHFAAKLELCALLCARTSSLSRQAAELSTRIKMRL